MLDKTEIQLIDFGSAIFEHEHHPSMATTRQYRAPEIIMGTSSFYPCDMWYVGCVLYELFTGDMLFKTHENLEHLAMMEKALGDLPSQLIEKASPAVQAYFGEEGKVRSPHHRRWPVTWNALKKSGVSKNRLGRTTPIIYTFWTWFEGCWSMTQNSGSRRAKHYGILFYKSRFDKNGDVVDDKGPANTMTTSRRSM